MNLSKSFLSVLRFEAYDGVQLMAPEPAPTLLRSTRPMTIEELAAAQGVKPMVSTDEWAADIFESDDELAAFLADVRASRDASPA